MGPLAPSFTLPPLGASGSAEPCATAAVVHQAMWSIAKPAAHGKIIVAAAFIEQELKNFYQWGTTLTDRLTQHSHGDKSLHRAW